MYIKADGEGKYRYATYFELAGIPGDHWGGEFDSDEYEDAQKYLAEDDMVRYYDDAGAEKLKGIYWVLEDNDVGDGFIVVDAFEELTPDELESISRFILGQCSDGLGEGFEQNFYYYNDDCGDYYYEDYDSSGCPHYCEFDWMTNKYELYRYGTNFSNSFWNLTDMKCGSWEQ